MAISKVVYKSSPSATPVTWMDATIATAAASDIASPKTAMLADGVVTQGTGTGGGGGTVSEPEKDVNFIDYDGTILYSYTATEAQALSALPSNPTHTGLTAQGWNWTLSKIKSQLNDCPNGKVWVGQMYVTASGKTEIDISLDEPSLLSPCLVIGVNGEVVVDWGDGGSTTTITGSSLTTRIYTNHTYLSRGEYTLSINATSGSFTFPAVSRVFADANNANAGYGRYTYSVKAIRLGSGITQLGNNGNNSLSDLYALEYITIPNTVADIGTYTFQNNARLRSLTIPSSVSSVGTYETDGCRTLIRISLPQSITTLNTYCFRYNPNLRSITIPKGISKLPNYALYFCYSLLEVSVPSTVTSIGTYVFNGDRSLKKIHMFPTVVPTLSNTNALSGIPTDCIIYVPYSSDHSILAAYQGASNWSTYSSYMQEEPQ